MKDYGKIIKEKRQNAGMYQDELAEKVGVSNKTISSWECGRTYPNMGQLGLLADIFGCTISEMMGRDDDVKFLVDITSRLDLDIIQKSGLLDRDDKLKILGRIEAMLESEKYR